MIYHNCVTQKINLESMLLLTLEGNEISVFETNDTKDILKTNNSSLPKDEESANDT